MCCVEAVLAVSVDGVAKHWLLSSRSEMKEMGGYIVEEKSQTLDLSSPPLSLSSYCYQGKHCTVLVVCKEAWQVTSSPRLVCTTKPHPPLSAALQCHRRENESLGDSTM